MSGRGGAVFLDRTAIAEALPILFDVAPLEVMGVAAAIDRTPLQCSCLICARRIEAFEAWMDEKGIEEDRRFWILAKKQRANAVPSMRAAIADRVKNWQRVRVA